MSFVKSGTDGISIFSCSHSSPILIGSKFDSIKYSFCNNSKILIISSKFSSFTSCSVGVNRLKPVNASVTLFNAITPKVITAKILSLIILPKYKLPPPIIKFFVAVIPYLL